MTKGTGEYYRHVLEGLGDEMGFDLDTPWKDLPKDARDAIMYGRDFKVQSRTATVGVACASIPPVSKAWCAR